MYVVCAVNVPVPVLRRTLTLLLPEFAVIISGSLSLLTSTTATAVGPEPVE